MPVWHFHSYPDFIWASVSSSGPLEAKLDFWEYYETAFDALGTTANGVDCQSNYTAAFEAAEEMLKVDYLYKIK